MGEDEFDMTSILEVEQQYVRDEREKNQDVYSREERQATQCYKRPRIHIDSGSDTSMSDVES